MSATGLPFSCESELEERICSDPEWRAGVGWGHARPGHREGAVVHHVADVLGNVDRVAASADERARLRLVALLHDACKHRVDRSKPRVGANHHAVLARRFAERYLDDGELLEIVELHDEAFNAWSLGARKGRWDEAEARARRLVERLGPSLPLYVRFYRADNATESKSPEPLTWFEKLLARRG